jgi:hypothetical protein
MMMQPGFYKIVQAVEQRERQAKAEQFRQCRVAKRRPRRADACP